MKGVRFAPSPTGIFHVGNLRTAWLSHELARRLGEPWVVRFEDIDPERSRLEFRARQLEDLVGLGLVPDEVIDQSSHLHRFESAFHHLIEKGMAYPCFCSRREVVEQLAGVAQAPHAPERLYSGRCRDLTQGDRTRLACRSEREIAWRFRSPDAAGDFIVARAPAPGKRGRFVPGYHWACALDDLWGGYLLLVRAVDLAPAIVPQRRVQAALAATEQSFPSVFHTALVVLDSGARLEKRTQGVTLSDLRARGVDESGLLERFKKSCDGADLDERLRAWGRRPGQVLQEGRVKLTLSELGL